MGMTWYNLTPDELCDLMCSGGEDNQIEEDEEEEL